MSHQHSVLHAYNESGDIFHPVTSTDDGELKVSNSSMTDGTQTTRLKANSNHLGTGTDYFVSCDQGGRLYVNSDLGIPINALNASNAVQSRRCVDGSLKTLTTPENQRATANILFNTSLSSSQLYGVKIDCREYNSLRVMGTATWAFNLHGSTDDSHYYKIAVVTPDSGHDDHYHHYLPNPPHYVRVKNGSSANTVTMYHSLNN